MTSQIRFLVFTTLFILGLFTSGADAFVKGSARVNSRPGFASGTSLGAAKKKAAKKAAVDTMKKADVVADIAERMECSKVDAERSLSAVLGTIQDVSFDS